jgi:predicted nucleotidyltransferase
MSVAERWVRFRKLPPNIKQKLEQLMPIFKQEQVQLVYLFGSLSQREKGHDVDLAILTKEAPAFHLQAAITSYLDTERLDLVDLRQASPVLKFEIVRTGRLLYSANETVEEQFVLSTLRQYKDTAWLRQQQDRYLRERMQQWSSNQNPSNSD